MTDIFHAVAAVSPSVWFPGWIEFAAEKHILADKVYLSLGNREEKTNNRIMARVGDNIRLQKELLDRQDIESVIVQCSLCRKGKKTVLPLLSRH